MKQFPKFVNFSSTPNYLGNAGSCIEMSINGFIRLWGYKHGKIILSESKGSFTWTVLGSTLASFLFFVIGVFFSPIVIPFLHDAQDRWIGCKAAYESGRDLIDNKVVTLLRDRSKSEEAHRYGKQAYRHFEVAARCNTPLGSNAMVAMAAMHCSGLGVPKINREAGQSLIFRAGTYPGASAGRIFSATISCREGDMKWVE